MMHYYGVPPVKNEGNTLGNWKVSRLSLLLKLEVHITSDQIEMGFIHSSYFWPPPRHDIYDGNDQNEAVMPLNSTRVMPGYSFSKSREIFSHKRFMILQVSLQSGAKNPRIYRWSLICFLRKLRELMMSRIFDFNTLWSISRQTSRQREWQKDRRTSLCW